MDYEYLGIKDIESILSGEIQNWLRWARSKDYLPPSFKCPLGFLYVPKRGDIAARLEKPAPIRTLEAADFEKVIINLPRKHRQAFVMYHLDRAKVNGRIEVRKRNGYENARLLGVHRSRYYVILTQAHNIVLRQWQKLGDQKIFSKR